MEELGRMEGEMEGGGRGGWRRVEEDGAGGGGWRGVEGGGGRMEEEGEGSMLHVYAYLRKRACT